MKKSAFQIAIASVVLSANVVAQQPGTINVQQMQNMLKPPLNQPNTVVNVGNGTLFDQQNPFQGGNQLESMPRNTGTLQLVPGVTAAQLVQRGKFMGTQMTPMGMAQGYSYQDKVYYLLSDNKVYSQ